MKAEAGRTTSRELSCIASMPLRIQVVPRLPELATPDALVEARADRLYRRAQDEEKAQSSGGGVLHGILDAVHNFGQDRAALEAEARAKARAAVAGIGAGGRASGGLVDVVALKHLFNEWQQARQRDHQHFLMTRLR